MLEEACRAIHRKAKLKRFGSDFPAPAFQFCLPDLACLGYVRNSPGLTRINRQTDTDLVSTTNIWTSWLSPLMENLRGSAAAGLT